MKKSFFDKCWLGVAGLLLAATAGCSRGGDDPKSPPDPVPSQGSEHFDSLNQRLANIEAQLTSLSNVSPDADGRLKTIEQKIGDKATWPKNLPAAEALRKELEQLVNGMSPMAQDSVVARLLRTRWAVRAIWTLCKADGGGQEQSGDMAEELQAVLEAEPESGPDHIRKELEQVIGLAEKVAHKAARQRALKAGEDAINGKGTDPVDAWEELQRFTAGDQEASTVRDKLKRTLAVLEIASRCRDLKTQRGRIPADSDEVTRQASLTRLYEAAVRYRLDVLLGQPDCAADLGDLNKIIAKLGEELRSLAKAQQDRQDALLRQYQKWALTQITEFDRWNYDRVLEDVKSTYAQMKVAETPLRWQLLEAFPSVRELLAERIDAEIPNGEMTSELQKQIYDKVAHLTHWSYATELAYRTTRDAMVKYLAPIDERLLDRPVQQLFSKSYTQSWAKLEGRDDQLFVAQQAAVVVKRGLADMK